MAEAWRVELHEAIASTQDVALAALAAGDMGRLAVRARRQTGGRGRAGREWIAPVGNLSLSLVLRLDPAPPAPGRFALLSGIALFDAVMAVAPEISRLSLKWPNDLMLGRGKLGGILIDSALTPAGLLDAVVIGIGVNLVDAPVIDGRETASLAGYSVAAEVLADAIMAAFDRWLSVPLAELRVAWLARAHPIGTKLRVRSSLGDIEGIFDGLAGDGALKLAGVAEAVVAGDVFYAGAV
jgi:BirA family biotin operon repressor/biotin-[acetyl-CoA-carboxylase] ligase